MTTLTATFFTPTRAITGRSWKIIARRMFEMMGKQYAQIPNML
jgi:hypothetical protein